MAVRLQRQPLRGQCIPTDGEQVRSGQHHGHRYTYRRLSTPISLAFDSSGNLYVANFSGNTVSKFAPDSTTPTAGGVTIRSSVESRPMLIGGTNSAPVAGINLTNAELAQIQTTRPARSRSATASKPATSLHDRHSGHHCRCST